MYMRIEQIFSWSEGISILRYQFFIYLHNIKTIHHALLIYIFDYFQQQPFDYSD